MVAARCKNGHKMQALGTTADDGWACDGAQEPGGCLGGLTGFYQSSGVQRYQCAGCNYDLCQKCVEAQLLACATSKRAMLTQDMPQDCKSAVVANVDSPPATREGFLWLHDEVALPLMRRSESLGRAYKVLDSANDLHIRLFGRASSHAIFNMACCLSLGASACAFPNDPAGRLLFDADASKKTGVGPQTGGAKVSSEKESTKYEALPPWWPEASRDQLAEARLDLATLMLEQALEAGFADRARLLLDLDLQALRDQRPKQFAAALKHVAPTMDEGGASATTTAAEASTSSSPPSSSPLSWSSAASTTSATYTPTRSTA